jgi:hypothetical protein
MFCEPADSMHYAIPVDRIGVVKFLCILMAHPCKKQITKNLFTI